MCPQRYMHILCLSVCLCMCTCFRQQSASPIEPSEILLLFFSSSVFLALSPSLVFWHTLQTTSSLLPPKPRSLSSAEGKGAYSQRWFCDRIEKVFPLLLFRLLLPPSISPPFPTIHSNFGKEGLSSRGCTFVLCYDHSHDRHIVNLRFFERWCATN